MCSTGYAEAARGEVEWRSRFIAFWEGTKGSGQYSIPQLRRTGYQIARAKGFKQMTQTFLNMHCCPALFGHDQVSR